jgi:hypothetical protein
LQLRVAPAAEFLNLTQRDVLATADDRFIGGKRGEFGSQCKRFRQRATKVMPDGSLFKK